MATKDHQRDTGLNIMFFTLNHCRLLWLGHILRMGYERVPKSLLYSELVDGRHKCGLLMTESNGDLLYTEVLKKEKCKRNVIRDLSRQRIKIKMSLFFVASLCLSCVSLVYFQYMYFLSTITHSQFRLTINNIYKMINSILEPPI